MNISHRERIPTGKPVILASNHPTAFIEPCIVASWMDVPLNFLARGDLYVNNPMVRRLYDWCHIVPVFRLDDIGYGGLKSNYDSFGKCYEALAANKRVMILAEGRTKHEKRLRPLMKGTARIVFGAIEKYPDLDIHVVPVGVNYTDPDQFRSEVRIDYGEPIRVQDYAAIYKENPAKAVAELTQALKNKLTQRVTHIEHPEDDTWVEPLLAIHRQKESAKPLPKFSTDPKPLFEEKALADRINAMSSEERNAMRSLVNQYTSLLEKSGTTDQGLMDKKSYSMVSALFLGVLWIPYMLGYALNILPVFLGNLFADKKTKTVEFRASVAIIVSMAFYMVYWLVCFLISLIIGKLWLILLVLAMPFLGYFAVIYRDIDHRWKARQRAAVIDDETEKQLLEMRAIIMAI